MATDLKLDPVTHDLVLVDGDFKLLIDKDEVGQSIKMRLLAVEGEWAYDATVGTPWFNGLFTTDTSLEQKEQILRERIMSCPEVVSVDTFEFAYDPSNRLARITYSATIADGELVVGSVTA